MGIDAIDLALRLEERFGIQISQPEIVAVLFDTPGAIQRYLLAKLRGEYHQTPRIEPLVMEVSRAVNRVAGRWRRLIPSTNMNTKLPPATRAARWLALGEVLGVSLPQLEHPAGHKFAQIPRQYESAISLTYWIAEHHPERLQWLPVGPESPADMATHPWTDNEVWDALLEVLCGVLGVKPNDVTPDARMIEDLGMD